MKKKIMSLLIAGVLAASVTACGGSSEPAADPADSETAEATEPAEPEEAEEITTGAVDKISLDNSEGSLVYTKHEVATDYDGNPALLVYFDYTNAKKETSYAQLTFYPQAFQNGVECEMAFMMDDNESISNAAKEIQTGTTLNVAFAYTLQDTESPVTLKVTDQSAENLLDDIYQEQELNLQ